MIQLQGVTKVYSNGAVGLNNVSLTIEKGEFVFITGNSGSGKSTFLKLLFKEIDPDHGKVIINNKDITKLKRRKVPYLRRDIGMVFQDFRLLPNKTVYENVAFAMQIVGATSREIRKNVPLVLGLVGLARKARCYPNELSGGEQQRTALARAIVNNPTMLIADEPTGNIDPDTSMEIMNILNDINKAGTTIIMATHDKGIVDRLKKRVIAIEKGVIVRDEQKGRYGYEN